MARNKFDIDEKLETPFSLSHLKRSLVYVKKHTKKMIAAMLMSAFAAIFSLISPLILKETLDNAIPNKNIKLLIILSVLLIITIVISIILTQQRAKIMTVVSNDIIYDIRNDLFQHLQKLPFSYYDDRPHGKILVRVVQYVNSVSDMLSNGLINFILEIFNIIFITIFMFIVSPKISLAIVAGLPVLILIMFLIKPAQRKAWQELSNKNSNLNAYLHESINGIKVTQIFTREEKNKEIFHTLCKNSKKAWIKAVSISNLVWFSVEHISLFIGIIIYFMGLFIIGPAHIQYGTLLAMSNYGSRFWQPINSLSNIYNNFMNSIAYLERIFETMDEPVSITDKEGAYELPQITGEVKFEDVVFSYDSSAVILDHINFCVKSGESVALVGPTGAGKTTIVNLISRFYDITDGSIRIDGHDISEVTIKSLRSQMGIMLQDSFIFSGNIRDNILYGKLDATDEEIMEACKTVRADEFINEMEKGLDTEVNERGSRLSQGQKQLISFARTLLADPKILILDEATSSIDTKTERLLQEGLLKLLKGRTSFIIAHRLSTIKNCDKIMYIGNKQILECGTHEELLAKKGEYYKLYTSQLT